MATCGGGRGDDSNSAGPSNGSSNGPSNENNNGGGTVTKVDALDLYTGSTDYGQSSIGWVDENNFCFLYLPLYETGVAGFISGNLSISYTTVSASTAKYFYFDASSVYDLALSGSVESKELKRI